MMFSTRASRRSFGLGVSLSGRVNQLRTAGDDSMRYFSKTPSAPSRVVASGTVGPEATTEGSSLGTSEIIKVTTCAGAAAAASRPPLMAERCFLTQLISVMAAPHLSSALLTD